MDSNKIGLFIKQLREEKKISQQQLADELFIDRSLISKWENGNLAPDIKYIKNLCKIFNVKIEEMIYGEKSNNNNESILKNNMFDFLLKQDSKYKRIKLISIVSVTLMIIILFLFLIYYFFQTYNTTKVYRIYGESDNYIIDNGILIITRENTYFKLGNINFSDNNIIIYSKNNGEDKIIYKGDSNKC